MAAIRSRLRRSLAIRQLPEAEGIADDDELCGRRPRGDLREELDELALEIAAGEPSVTTDVQVADEVVGGRHRTHLDGRAVRARVQRMHPPRLLDGVGLAQC